VNSTFQTSVGTPLRAACFYTTRNPDLEILDWRSVSFSQAAPALGWVANAASQVQDAVAPGEIISVYGPGIGPETPASLALDSSGNVARQLGGVQISFDGTAAPLLYVSGTQVNAIVPYEIAGQSVTRMQLSLNNTPAMEWDLPVASSMPAIFTAYTSTQAAVLNQDNTVNGGGNPAARGSVIQIFATGEGETTPTGITAEVTGTDLKQPQLPVTVSIGGITAQTTYIGSAPEAVAGLFQVNAVVPQSTTPGTAIPITIRVGTLVSPTASIAVK
jgi:uncharacterized protein (TIGR03437 family)